MNIPEDLRYTKTHEWARKEDDEIVCGITDYAQRELADIIAVNLVSPGTLLEKGEKFGTVEAVKAVEDLFTPMSGEVIDINSELASQPEIVNEDPYGKGWMIRIKVSNPSEWDELMDATTYREYVMKLLKG